jgi:hypothetical protein
VAPLKKGDFDSNTTRLSPKTLTRVGWVEERNPTFGGFVGFRRASTQPTIFLNRAVLTLIPVPPFLRG